MAYLYRTVIKFQKNRKRSKHETAETVFGVRSIRDVVIENADGSVNNVRTTRFPKYFATIVVPVNNAHVFSFLITKNFKPTDELLNWRLNAWSRKCATIIKRLTPIVVFFSELSERRLMTNENIYREIGPRTRKYAVFEVGHVTITNVDARSTAFVKASSFIHY